MIEPTLALQAAIKTRLLSTADVMERVPADNIRDGSTRRDKTPAIIMSDGTTSLHGYDYTAQRTAWVYLDLHIWTTGDGQDCAKEIAGMVMSALDKHDMQIDGGDCDHFRVTKARFPRDPDPAYGHGILSVEALIRWTV